MFYKCNLNYMYYMFMKTHLIYVTMNLNPLTYINAFPRTLTHLRYMIIENFMKNGAFAL